MEEVEGHQGRIEKGCRGCSVARDPATTEEVVEAMGKLEETARLTLSNHYWMLRRGCMTTSYK